uniref:Telomere-associated protein Rif1 N-terminal domain-containing protein n=1 Tax=Clytia hemisphaerica TaxID=252671 RepID=A0A7M5VBR8_9CNID
MKLLSISLRNYAMKNPGHSIMSKNSEDTVASIENLLQIIRSIKCTNEDKTDAYLTLFRLIQSNKQESISIITKQINSVLNTVQKHIQHNERSLAEAAITFLGYCLAIEEINFVCKDESLKNISKALCQILETNGEKTVIIRTLWCFCNQSMKKDIIEQYVERILVFFSTLKENDKIKSETIYNEALKVIKKFCEQCPDSMRSNHDKWAPEMINSLTSKVIKNQEVGFSALEASINVLMVNQEFVSSLLQRLNETEFSQTLNGLYDENQVHVLNVWACLLRIIGESFFQFNRIKVTNPLLKIAEKAFASKSPEVLLALNNLWRSLIDCVFTRPSEFFKRMEKIFLLPLKVRYKNEIVAQESLKTQWYLLCNINQNVNDYIEKAIFVVFDLYLPTADATQAAVATSTNNNMKTPDRRKSIHKSPKSPFNAPPKVKLLLAEMMLQLLTPLERRHQLKSQLELFKGPCIDKKILIKYCNKFICYLSDLTTSCTPKHENSIANVWYAFLVQLRQDSVECESSAVLKEVWGPITNSLKERVEQWSLSATSILKLLLLIPESFLKMTVGSVGLKNGSEDEQISLFVIRLLLHKNFIDHEGYESERFFILFERAIGVVFSSMTDQLRNVDRIFNILEESHGHLTNQDVRWRLWSTLTSLLQGYIIKTNNVNQDGSMDHNFAAILKSLTYTVRFINLSKLQEGTFNELLKVWQEIMEAFCRGVSLLSAEPNIAVEAFCKSLVSSKVIQNATDVKTLSTVIKMISTTTKHLDFSNLTPVYTARLTPTKISKRLNNPLGNFESFVNVIEHCIEKSFELMPKGKQVEITFIELLESVEYFFTKIESENIVTSSLHHFAPYLSQLFDPKMKSSSKILMKGEKVITQVYKSLENINEMNYTNDTLSKLDILLSKTLATTRKSLRMRTATFWNHTFGKKTGLTYSEELKSVLTKYQAKLSLNVPGMKAPVTQDITFSQLMDDTAQFPEDSSQVSTFMSPSKLKTKPSTHQSPVKIHGSFLSKHKKSPSNKLGSPKDVLGNFLASGSTKSSPKSPFKNSPATTKHVRRKLPIMREDSCDFVEIKDSPGTKKKRLLTEHQKEIMRERKELPAMYNTLDNSQDTTLMRALSQDMTQMTQESLFRIPEQPEPNSDAKEQSADQMEEEMVKEMDEEPLPVSKVSEKETIIETKSDTSKQPSNETCIIKEDDIFEKTNDIHEKETETKAQNKTNEKETIDFEVEEKHVEEETESSDIIPSSQTQEPQSQKKRGRKSMLKSKTNTTDSILLGFNDIFPDKESEKEGETSCQETEVIKPTEDPTTVLLSEDVELFDAPSSNRDNFSLTNTEESANQKDAPEQSTNEKKEENKADESSTNEKPSDQPILAMEPKIIVDKLPNKRKRSVPTAKRTGYKRKRTEETTNSKENKLPTKRTRRSLGAAKHEKPLPPQESVFDFTETEQPTTDIIRRRSKARKSVPASFKLKETETKDKEQIVRPVPQFSVTEPEQPIIDNKETILLSSQSMENKVEQNPDSIINGLESEPIKSDIVDEVSNKLPVPDLEKLQELSSPLPKTLPSIAKKYRDAPTPFARHVASVSSPLSGNIPTVSSPLLRNQPSVSSPLSRNKVTVSSQISSVPSPLGKPSISRLVKSPFVNYSTCSPTRASTDYAHSPCASPAGGILKKRLTPFACVDSPSPPNKRRVSFQLPGGTILSCDEMEKITEAEDEEVIKTTRSPFYTSLKRKSRDNLQSKLKKGKDQQKEQTSKEQNNNNNTNTTINSKSAVFPDLVKCTAPIERVLPSLTFSRGFGHLVRAQNINTVGDLSSLSENQIEALPIRSPKVKTVRSALRNFTTQMSRDKVVPKSPLVMGKLNDESLLDSTTPTKDETTLVEEASLLLTPSRYHQEDEVKRTSLFNEKGDEISGDVSTEKPIPACAMEIDLSENPKEIISETEEEISCTPPVTEEKSEIPTPLTPPEETVKILPEVEVNPVQERTETEVIELPSKCDFTMQTPEKASPKKTLMEILDDHDLNFDQLTNKQLFEMIGKLDVFKSNIMTELQNRIANKE